MRKTFLILLTLIFACHDNKEKESDPILKTLDFKSFTIQTPNHWTIITTDGIDSYVREIDIGHGDTLTVDFGYYSNSMTEYEPTILPISYMTEMLKNKRDTSGIIFTDNPQKINIDKIKKQNVIFDTINGYEAKIVFPRKSGRGQTGVYFDSLYNDAQGIGKTKLNLSGINLKHLNEQDLLKAIRTMKIKQRQIDVKIKVAE